MKKYLSDNKIQLYIMAIAVFVVSIPLGTDYINYGEDIAASLTGIRDITGVFYLLPGALYRLGINMQFVYKLTVILCNIFTAAFAYVSFGRITKSGYGGLVAAFAYMLCPARIYSIYMAGNLDEAFAWIFLPLIIWGWYVLYTEGEREHRYTLWILAAGYGFVALSSFVYFFGACILAIVIFLMNIKNGMKRNLLIFYVKLIALNVLLGGWRIVLLLVRMRDVSVVAPMLKEDIRSYGVNIIQYIKVFEFGGDGVNSWISGMYSSAAIGPGFVIIAIVTAYIVAGYVFGKNNKEAERMLIAAIIMAILSSNIFPWDIIQNKNMLFSVILAFLGTPAKLAVMADLLLITAAGIIVSNGKDLCGEMNYKRAVYGLCLAILLPAQFQLGRISTTREYMKNVQIEEIVSERQTEGID